MVREPLVRARHMKELLGSVDRLPVAQTRAIRAALAEEHQRAIADAATVGWLPMDANLALARALAAVLGPAECHRFHRAHFANVLQGPVLGTLLRGALALYGHDPSRWMRLLPAAWDLLFRDCGAWTVSTGDAASVDLCLGDLPPGCVADLVWPTTVASSISATLHLSRKEGAVEVLDVDRSARRARYAMRWS